MRIGIPLFPDTQKYESLLQFVDKIYSFCIWLSGVALVAMTVIIPIGIFNRYVLGQGSAWPEPIAILCMVTFTFLGAAASYRARAHLAVTMLVSRLPESLGHLCAVLVDVLLAVISLFVLWYGSLLCLELWNQPIAEFPVLTAGQAYIPLPIGSAVMLLFIAESFLFGPQTKRPVVTIGTVGGTEDEVPAEAKDL